MKQLFLSFIVFLSLHPICAHGQKVPPKVLEQLIKKYTDMGMKLEQSFLPDFNLAHPNKSFRYTSCYPGKKIIIATVFAQKPSDWMFKVSNGGKVAPNNPIKEVQIDGASYWFDSIMKEFPSSFSDHSEKCMGIFAYDRNAQGMPVYMYIFSIAN